MLRRYTNAGYDPQEARIDVEIRCGVCGWWNDEETTSEPTDFAGITLITTGSQWYIVGGGVEGLAQKDLQTEPRVVGGCRLCGSGNWRGGNGLEGLAPPG